MYIDYIVGLLAVGLGLIHRPTAIHRNDLKNCFTVDP